MTELTIADKSLTSRLILGSARYPDPETMRQALRASGTEMVTVALRRVNLEQKNKDDVLGYLIEDGYHLLPNTAGCYTAREAVMTAQLGREALETNLIKLEVIGDEDTLFPDIPELLKAAEQLLQDDFVVLPYTNDDPVTCRKLADMGCAAVMPLAAPIGSGMGICNRYNLQIIREQVDIPIIVDAGVGTASDVALTMELGMDGVLMNSAIARAEHPVMMAEAMKSALTAGRLAREAGRIPRRLYASASSPTDGMIDLTASND